MNLNYPHQNQVQKNDKNVWNTWETVFFGKSKKDGTACGPDSVHVYQASPLEVNGYPWKHDESMFL